MYTSLPTTVIAFACGGTNCLSNCWHNISPNFRDESDFPNDVNIGAETATAFAIPSLFLIALGYKEEK